jgi:hypothetical protein
MWITWLEGIRKEAALAICQRNKRHVSEGNDENHKYSFKIHALGHLGDLT